MRSVLLAFAFAAFALPAAGYSALTTVRQLHAAAICKVAPRTEGCYAQATGIKVLTCSRCKATYTVDDIEAFGEGKQVKCSNCDHEWYQTASRLGDMPTDMELIEYPAEMKDRIARGLPAEPIARYRCFVGNLPFVATEDELRELFERYGAVASVSVMVDETGRPKGFGFVNMESMLAGAKAVEELDGYEMHGRSITVSEGKQSTSRDGGRGRGRGRGDGRGRGRGDGRGRGRGDGRGRGRGRGRGYDSD